MPQASLLTWLNKPQSVMQPRKSQLSISPLNPISSHMPSPFSFTNKTASNPEINHPTSNPLPDSSIPPPSNLSLHPNMTLKPCTPTDLPALKRLTTLLLPIPYPESFYREILNDPTTNKLTILAFWKDTPRKTDLSPPKEVLVGAIRCRLLPPPAPSGLSLSSTKPKRNNQNPSPQHPNQTGNNPTHLETENRILYISTLAVLSPYRRHGIGQSLIETVTSRAKSEFGVESVGAHVWEADSEAQDWYSRRGFQRVGREEGYYRRLKPPGAVVLRREVGDGEGKGREG